MRGHVQGGPGLASVHGLDDAGAIARVVRPGPVDHRLVHRPEAAHLLGDTRRQVVDRPPAFAAVPRRVEALLLGQRTGPADELAGESKTPEIDRPARRRERRLKLDVPPGAAIRRLEDLAVAVDGPAGVEIPELDIVVARTHETGARR